MDKKSYCIAWLMLLFVGSLHAQYRTTTYCNPLNLDYTYPFHNSHLGKSYRSGADPAVVGFRGGVLYVRYPFLGLLAFQGLAELGLYYSRKMVFRRLQCSCCP